MDEALPISIQLPNEAKAEIVQILVEIFRYQFHQDITEHPEEMKRLQAMAVDIRNQLEKATEVPVAVDNILGQYHLHTVLQRAEVKAWLQLKKEKQVFQKDPPKNCPVCKQPLMNQWNCISCGLELESPYRRMQNRGASQKSTRFLPYHHALLADPERSRVVFLDCHFNHQVVWEIAKEQWDLQAPWQALFLESNHILVVDQAGHRLVETTLFGEVVWEWKGQGSPADALKNPVKVSVFKHEQEPRILLVDQGHHRVMILDRDQNLIWQYGTQGQAGKNDNQLNLPSDAFMTAEGNVLIADTGNGRVIEVNPRTDTTVWLSPPHLELKQPVALRRIQDRLQIVDAGRDAILELDMQGEIDEECHYFTKSLDPNFKLQGFVQAFRRENGHIMLSDKRRVIEVDIEQKHLLWMSVLNDLNFKYHDQVARTLSRDEAYFERVNKAFRPQKTFKLKEVLKQVKVFKDAPAGFFDALQPLLTQHSYGSDKQIVKQGEMGSDMYFIQSGQVEVYQEPRQHLATLETGDIFGEMALLFSEPRNASVKTRKPTELYRLSKTAFETAIKDYPEIRKQITRLAESREQVNWLKQKNAYSLEKASGHLKALLDKQREKLSSIKNKYKHSPKAVIHFKPAWRLTYTKIEQHIIHEAIHQHMHCFEIHLALNHHHWSIEELGQMVAALEQHGTVIKMFPDPDAILNGALETSAINQTLALSYLSEQTKAMVLEDLTAFESVGHIQLFTIFF